MLSVRDNKLSGTRRCEAKSAQQSNAQFHFTRLLRVHETGHQLRTLGRSRLTRARRSGFTPGMLLGDQRYTALHAITAGPAGQLRLTSGNI
jgi:hypothetical protein